MQSWREVLEHCTSDAGNAKLHGTSAMQLGMSEYLLELSLVYHCARVALQNSPFAPYTFVTVHNAKAVLE